MVSFIEGQKVVITGNTVCHGLELGSVHVIDDIIGWKNQEWTVVIGLWYVPFNNLKAYEE